MAQNVTDMPDVCTIQTCPLEWAYLDYFPTYAGNLAYLVIFALLLVLQTGLGAWYRTWGFLVGMICGLLLEVLGYVGRLKLNKNPFEFDAFLLYLIPLTLGPAFLAASIYLCLARIVTVYGADLSRLRPRTYTIVFIACDFLSLVLQSVGGALAATSETDADGDTGVRIMVAGLAFQVFSLLLFMALWAEFVWTVRRVPDGRKDQRFEWLRLSFKFKAFQYSLWAAAIFIFIRSVFRVAELQEGFDGPIMQNEAVFMVLEGPMIILATLVLTVLHPGFAFSGSWHAATWTFRQKKHNDAMALRRGGWESSSPLKSSQV